MTMATDLRATMSSSDIGRSALAIILAGGQGQRLVPLTSYIAKPAVRFAGSYRMIDFTLSNCINSGLRRIYLLTQYASSSLNRHVRKGFAPLLSDDLGEFIDIVPPQGVHVERWYAGTADAVFQNLDILQQQRPPNVLILSGDHVYSTHYGPMLQQHEQTGAALTIACLVLPREQGRHLGVISTASGTKVQHFVEKPDDPPPMPGNPDMCLVNMGVYVWRTETLVEQVIANARSDAPRDFGQSIIPAMVAAGEDVHAWQFTSAGAGGEDYWRDVGTLSSYWEAHSDLVSPTPKFNLYDAAWPVYTHRPVGPPAKLSSAGKPDDLHVADTIISAGCLIRGSQVERSVLSPGVCIDRACVRESILMDHVTVEPGARLTKVIVAEGVTIPADIVIGEDRAADTRRFVVTDDGITVVPSRIVLDEEGFTHVGGFA